MFDRATVILTDLADLAEVWDEPQPDFPDTPQPLPRSWGVGLRTQPRPDGHCGWWENGAPRFFGVGPLALRKRT